MNPTISAYMRRLQRKAAKSRWADLTKDQRKEKMSALAKARWVKRPKKPKRVARRSNDQGQARLPGSGAAPGK